MTRYSRRLLPVVFSASLLWPALSAAQDQPPPQDSPAKPLTPKELKKRQRQLIKELSSVDATWLREEVPDIITEQERRAFLELGTQEEREQFIEIFWRSRNPEPESPINPVREEHYRRLRR